MNQEPPKPREILFRGYARHGWVYGGINFTQDNTMIGNGGIWHAVYPETVGQFTGLKDAKGKGIFEHDIVLEDGTWKAEIFWNDEMGMWDWKAVREDDGACEDCLWNKLDVLEVIGNKFEIGG